MTCKEILKDAKKLIGGSRQKDYGDKLTNHQKRNRAIYKEIK
jgi:hypothetical protein